MTQQIDKDRFFGMAACYDRMAPYLVPRYDFLQSEVVELLFAQEQAPRLVVDLGAGSGIFLERILARSAAARAVWVDYSDDFQAVARERLKPYGDRVSFVLVGLTEPWEAHLPDAPDAICSMSAIHHLEHDAKRRLYQRCHDVLRPGGWFYNIDEMAAPSADAYLNTMRYWVRHVEQADSRVPRELLPHHHAWCERFAKWKLRNIDNRGQPKLPGDDIHESYIEQLQWLRDAGFADVDLFLKFQLWSVIGGRRPTQPT